MSWHQSASTYIECSDNKSNTIICFKRVSKTLFRLWDWDFRAFELRRTKQQESYLRAWSSGPRSIDRLRLDLKVREVGWKQSKWPNGSRLDHCWYYRTKSIQSIGTRMVGKVCTCWEWPTYLILKKCISNHILIRKNLGNSYYYENWPEVQVITILTRTLIKQYKYTVQSKCITFYTLASYL